MESDSIFIDFKFSKMTFESATDINQLVEFVEIEALHGIIYVRQ